jgi:hypothetical protein
MKESAYSFLGMLKRGDDDDEVDDEVRTSGPSQNRVTATLSSEESSLRTSVVFIALTSYQLRDVVRG